MIRGYDDEEWERAVRGKNREKIQYERVTLPKILQAAVQEKVPFVTRFRAVDAHASKLSFAKEGVHKPGPYTAPGPHAFRGDDFRKVRGDNCIFIVNSLTN